MSSYDINVPGCWCSLAGVPAAARRPSLFDHPAPLAGALGAEDMAPEVLAGAQMAPLLAGQDPAAHRA